MSGLNFKIVPFRSCGPFEFGSSVDCALTKCSEEYRKNGRKNGGVAYQFELFTLVFSPQLTLEEIVLLDGCDLCIEDISIFSEHDVLGRLAEVFGSPQKHLGDLVYSHAGLILGEFEGIVEYGRSVSVGTQAFIDKFLSI